MEAMRNSSAARVVGRNKTSISSSSTNQSGADPGSGTSAVRSNDWVVDEIWPFGRNWCVQRLSRRGPPWFNWFPKWRRQRAVLPGDQLEDRYSIELPTRDARWHEITCYQVLTIVNPEPPVYSIGEHNYDCTRLREHVRDAYVLHALADVIKELNESELGLTSNEELAERVLAYPYRIRRRISACKDCIEKLCGVRIRLSINLVQPVEEVRRAQEEAWRCSIAADNLRLVAQSEGEATAMRLAAIMEMLRSSNSALTDDQLRLLAVRLLEYQTATSRTVFTNNPGLEIPTSANQAHPEHSTDTPLVVVAMGTTNSDAFALTSGPRFGERSHRTYSEGQGRNELQPRRIEQRANLRLDLHRRKHPLGFLKRPSN